MCKNIGYYIFFSYGDYHPPFEESKSWVSTWNLNDWKIFIDELVDLETNTLMLYLNGHKLPYHSKRYPSLVDTLHLNCQKEFLPALLTYVKERGLKIIAVITTTGHAGRFAELNQELKIEPPPSDISTEDTLISFPEHLRKGKLFKKEGAAQIGYGVLCHNKESSQQYAIELLSELISLYGNYLDGIALHPPESAYPCTCSACEQKYLIETGNALQIGNPALTRLFFISSYLKFQKEILIPLINTKLPLCSIMLFTIPWLFESSFNKLVPFIPPEVTLIEWDYNLDKKRLESLYDRLKEYKAQGYKLWFMPTAGFSFSNTLSIEEQIAAVHQQLKSAEEIGANGIIHFLGPRKSDFLLETSWKSYSLDSSLKMSSFSF